VSHAKRVLLGLLESPAQYHDHATAYAVSVILKLTYGRNTNTDASHPDVLELRRSLRRFATIFRPGFYLVDSLPWLKYLPWYGRDLRRGFIEDRSFFRRLLDAVKSEMSDPNSGPSFVKFLLAREIDFGLDETEMAFLAGSLFSAGAHTTALAICISMMAAALHPDAQAAVHAELDAVVSNRRLPAFDDEESLPLLRAFILESMRWRPLSTLGIAHRATEDIIWGDYHIPVGTTVIGNHWAISRDPEVFPDPDRFDMRRWLTSDKKVREDVKFPYFGFGRRVCPGQQVATTSIYINTAFILWAFDISVDESKPIDDLGFLDEKSYPIGLHFKPRVPAETLKEIIDSL